MTVGEFKRVLEKHEDWESVKLLFPECSVKNAIDIKEVYSITATLDFECRGVYIQLPDA